MIQVSELEKGYGGRVLFKDISFAINQGEKVALLGRNGTGKSTLFKILIGQEGSDKGDIIIPKGYRIGYLKQYFEFKHDTILDECATALAPDDQYSVYKVEKVLMGLGFTEDDFYRSPHEFSGGYQMRLELTKLIISEPDLILLDEPTNYLDIVSMLWLQDFLKSFRGELILISHDREFIDSICNEMMGIHRQNLLKIPGKTEDYYSFLEEAEEINEKTRLNQEKKIKEMQNFVDKFRAKARQASQAQSRLKQLEKMEKIEKLDSIKSMGLQFRYTDCPSKTVMEAKNLTFGYDPEIKLFSELGFFLGKSDCLAIIGKNGKGKSTLLNVLAKELNPEIGEVKFHSSARFSHFGQSNIDRLDENNTVVQEVQSANSDLSTTAVRSICGSMMFEGDDADKFVRVLSGGEKSRVMLGKILANPSNILFLDEPTHHLDVESVEILVEQLKKYEGAVVIVTHSEMILRALATKIIVFREGNAEYFDGNYDYFLEKIGWEVEGRPKKKKISKKQFKQKRSELINARSKEASPLKKKIDDYEEQITKSESRLEELNVKLVKASEEAKGDEINKYSSEISSLQKEIDELFEKLESTSETYTNIMQKYDEELKKLDQIS